MDSFVGCWNKIQNLLSNSRLKLASLCRWTIFVHVCFFQYVLCILNPIMIRILYFLAISFLSFWILRGSNPKTETFKPRDLDLFFTSVSAATASSMSTVEMEVFSNKQLLVLTISMFVGSQVFTSLVGLHLGRFTLRNFYIKRMKVGSSSFQSSPPNFLDKIELGILEILDSENSLAEVNSVDREYLRYKSIKFLSYVLINYLLVIHIIGVSLVVLYFSLVSSAKNILETKGLKLFTFSLFTIVSTFANCGFIPTNENMIVFRKNSGLLWILIPQVLFGNTLFPPFLRFILWLIAKFTKRNEPSFLLANSVEAEYFHLLPSLHSSFLSITVVGLILVQFILFCSMEWNSTALVGMTSYEKFAGIIFQTMNTRHSGESIVDLSTVTQAVLVLFIVMMYLPPYTYFIPVKYLDDERYSQEYERKRKRRGKVMENFIFSQLFYLALFTILICITEKKRIESDPLNFNVLNIVVEVVSAYGNVGFSTGYSCARQLKPGKECQDKWYGFSGHWSDKGKLILIFVMLLGRFKKLGMDGGKAWKLM